MSGSDAPTRLSASVFVGEIVRPRPNPVSTIPGTCSGYDRYGSASVQASIPSVETVSPVSTGGRTPARSNHRPPSWAATVIGRTIARTASRS